MTAPGATRPCDRPATFDRWLTLGLALGLFAVYAAGACRTIYVGDSGELVTAVHLLGIPHPSGYPLYVLLGKLWTLLVPLGSIAWRMSLFSAAAAAIACGWLFVAVRRLGATRPPALLAALLLAFAPSFWGEANVQRVYALNALFLIAAVDLTLRWSVDRNRRWLVAAAGVCGLGATNHTFMAVAALAIGLAVALDTPALLRQGRLVLAGAGAFALGLLPYAWLPWRSRQDPPLDWGNPDTLDRLLAVVTRRDFWARRYWQGWADLPPIAGDWLHSLGSEMLWADLPLAALAVGTAWATLRVSKRAASDIRLAPARAASVLAPARASSSVPPSSLRITLPLLVMLANLATMAAHGSRSDLFIWHRYYIPSYAMLALLAGLGAAALCRRLPPRTDWVSWTLIAIPLALLATGWRAADRSHYAIADDYSRQLLAGLPPGAHLAASDDNILFVLMYLRWVEGLRPDVDLILQGVGDAALPPLHFEPGSDPLYFTHDPNWSNPALDVVPVGLAFEVVRHGTAPSAWRLPTDPPGVDDPAVPKDYLTQNLLGELYYMRALTRAAQSPDDWAAVRADFARAMREAPNNDVLFYNLGLIFRRHGDLADALAAFERSAAINPRAIAGSRPVWARDRVREVAQELATQSGQNSTPRPKT